MPSLRQVLAFADDVHLKADVLDHGVNEIARSPRSRRDAWMAAAMPCLKHSCLDALVDVLAMSVYQLASSVQPLSGACSCRWRAPQADAF